MVGLVRIKHLETGQNCPYGGGGGKAMTFCAFTGCPMFLECRVWKGKQSGFRGWGNGNRGEFVVRCVLVGPERGGEVTGRLPRRRVSQYSKVGQREGG